VHFVLEPKTFYNEEKTSKDLAVFILQTKRLSFGEECQKFEKTFSIWQGRRFCSFVNSGSSANLALIQALLNIGKIKKGDRVGFSAVTWSTSVMPIIQLGLNPVAIDVELGNLNISSNTLEDSLKKNKISVLFITNLLGFCGDMENIVKICKKNNIILVEDNCESLGTIYKGKKLGNYGYASTFSFYVGHHMSTVEGGMVCTDDEDLSTMIKLVRAHGWDRNLDFKKQDDLRKKFKINSEFYSRYTFYDLGYNLRPTEINGFLGNNQIKYLDLIIEQRSNNFLKFAKKLYKNNNYFEIDYSHIDRVSSFAFPIICKDFKIKEALVKKCKGWVEIRPIVGGDITQQPFFSRYVDIKSVNCPNAKIIYNNGLYFGNNPELTEKDFYIYEQIFINEL